MADDIDMLQEREQILLDAQIRARKPEGPQPTGECLYCSTPVAENRRWCDAECCRAWEDENHPSLPQRR